MPSIVGICSPHKPFPSIVEEHASELLDARRVLDVGSGDGRFAQWFLSRSRVLEEYVAVEPSPKLVNRMFRRYPWMRSDSRLRVLQALWEEVRDELLCMDWDVVVFWDVAMFMDLRGAHGIDDPVEAVKRELDLLIARTRYLLFSLHPVKQYVIPRERYKELLGYLDSHPKLKLLGKRYLNRVYRVT